MSVLDVDSAMESEENAFVVPQSIRNRAILSAEPKLWPVTADLARGVLGTRGFEGSEEGPVEGDRSQPSREVIGCGADILMGTSTGVAFAREEVGLRRTHCAPVVCLTVVGGLIRDAHVFARPPCNSHTTTVTVRHGVQHDQAVSTVEADAHDVHGAVLPQRARRRVGRVRAKEQQVTDGS